MLDGGGVLVTGVVPGADKAALDVSRWTLVFLFCFCISDVLKIDEGLLLRIVLKPFLRGQRVSLRGLFCLLTLLLQWLGEHCQEGSGTGVVLAWGCPCQRSCKLAARGAV